MKTAALVYADYGIVMEWYINVKIQLLVWHLSSHSVSVTLRSNKFHCLTFNSLTTCQNYNIGTSLNQLYLIHR